MPLTPRSFATFVLAALLAAAAAAQGPLEFDANAMNRKIARMLDTADSERAPTAPPVRTQFTEREANAYFEIYGPDFLPPGVARPQITLGDNGRVAARAVVDLDAVRTARDRSLLDPLAFVGGAVEVVASGNVSAADGRGLLRFEAATVGGVSVPKTVAQELLRFYTRSPQRPQGFAFDEPFDLPAGIRGAAVARGQATVTQ
jgi:hypothetical protein